MDVVILGAALKGAKAYTDATISPLLGGVHYRGSVNYFNNLPSNPSEGDAYTVKYSGTSGTSSDGTEYVWALDTDDNTYKWIGFSPDTYTKAEVDNLLNGKQATIDSSHKLSSDLVDDTNAANKFATAAELEQIETNKNNISLINHAANTSLYFSETEPTGTITQGSYWISTTAIKIFTPTANLFNEIYTGLNVDITYRPMQVGDIDVTLSTTAPKTTQENAACLFLLAGNVSTGASTSDNGAWVGQNRTVTALNGYITIGYRHIGDVNPQDYDTMLNAGDTALPYVAYGNAWQ